MVTVLRNLAMNRWGRIGEETQLPQIYWFPTINHVSCQRGSNALPYAACSVHWSRHTSVGVRRVNALVQYFFRGFDMPCRPKTARSSHRAPLSDYRVDLLGKRTASFLLAGLMCVTTVMPVAAQEAAPAKPLAAPGQTDSLVARLIAALMPRNHISGESVNDKVSERALDLFLNSLDPMKLYFYQSDIDEFSRYKTQIDDMVRAGDISLAYTIFKRFTQRVDQQVAVAQDLLKGPFDFQKDETIIIDPESTQYARTPDETRDRWRRQIKCA